MQIVITVQVREIQAPSWEEAKKIAWQSLQDDGCAVILGQLGFSHFEDFDFNSRIAREADGTYTVTIP